MGYVKMPLLTQGEFEELVKLRRVNKVTMLRFKAVLVDGKSVSQVAADSGISTQALYASLKRIVSLTETGTASVARKVLSLCQQKGVPVNALVIMLLRLAEHYPITPVLNETNFFESSTPVKKQVATKSKPPVKKATVGRRFTAKLVKKCLKPFVGEAEFYYACLTHFGHGRKVSRVASALNISTDRVKEHLERGLPYIEEQEAS